MRGRLPVVALLVAVSLAAGLAGQKPAPLFCDGFRAGAGVWQFRAGSGWKVVADSSDSVLCLVQPGKIGKIRAPASWAVRKGVDVKGFVFEGRFRCTAPVDVSSRDLCVIFNFQDSVHFAYVHFSARSDRVHNIIGLVNGADRVKINLEPPGKSEARLVDQRWHRFRVTYDAGTGRVRAFLDDFTRPVLTAVDTILRHGSVGVGSFDDTGCFDNLCLWSQTGPKGRK